MDDLYSVTFNQGCRVPIRAPDYLAVHLDRQPVGSQTQVPDKLGNAYSVGQLGIVAIYFDCQFRPSVFELVRPDE
jgi:hypothetical protein